jgi:hypothetical protein
MNESRHYIEMCQSLARHPNSTYAYLLDHGQEWGPVIAPADVKPGPPKHCYQNSYRLAAHHPGRFFYVEGYALGVIPVPHAWCVDRAGRVIDCTWEPLEIGADYFGVKFHMPTLHAVQRITGSYSVLAHWEHWNDIRAALTGRKSKRRKVRAQCGHIKQARR